MNWADWAMGFFYGTGFGAIIVGAVQAKTISIQKKTIATQKFTITSLINTTTLQQNIITKLERGNRGPVQAGSEVGTDWSDQPF